MICAVPSIAMPSSRVRVVCDPATASGGVVFGPDDDLGMRPEPDPLARFRVPDELIEDPDPRPIADDVRVHRELKDAALIVRCIEFAPENIEHIVRRRVGTE